MSTQKKFDVTYAHYLASLAAYNQLADAGAPQSLLDAADVFKGELDARCYDLSRQIEANTNDLTKQIRAEAAHAIAAHQ